MDIVAELNAKSTDIPTIREPTFAAFAPLLEKNRSIIESVPKKTFKYGETDRHQLDVYYPSRHPDSKLPPILLFSYGGGLVSGDRTLPNTNGLVYANVGSYFAHKGYLTIVADYRLVPHVTFPGPAKDVADALEWVVKNLADVGDTEKIFIMGHSAGALHQATMVLYSSPSSGAEEVLLTEDVRARIKGMIWNGGPYAFRLEGDDPLAGLGQVLNQYYQFGDDTDVLTARSPFGLLNSASSKFVEKLPPLLMITAEYEPQSIVDALNLFSNLMYQKKDGKDVEAFEVDNYVNVGHNHISSMVGLGSGEGESWTGYVLDWLAKKST